MTVCRVRVREVPADGDCKRASCRVIPPHPNEDALAPRLRYRCPTTHSSTQRGHRGVRRRCAPLLGGQGPGYMGSLIHVLYCREPPAQFMRDRALREPGSSAGRSERFCVWQKDGCCIHEYYQEAPPEVLAPTRREIYFPRYYVTCRGSLHRENTHEKLAPPSPRAPELGPSFKRHRPSASTSRWRCWRSGTRAALTGSARVSKIDFEWTGLKLQDPRKAI